MLTRRQFLVGMGAFAATTFLTFTLGDINAVSREKKGEEKPLPPPLDCDWVIDNVIIADGTGASPYWGKVAVKGEKIVAVGEFTIPAGASRTDGQGLVLSPGFIDIHTHTEDYVYSGESMAAFLAQGVTTQIGGNCGRSPGDVASYVATMPAPSINYGLLYGYATLREKTMGRNNHGKTPAGKISAMQEMLARELQAGAVGLSVGLEYYPQTYATTEELIALCEVVKEAGGFYSTHIRSEYDNVIPALEEAIEIGIITGVPVQYSHIKAGHQKNWSKFPRLLELLEEAQRSGLDITADVYPYTFSSTDLGTKPLQHSISEENLEAALIHPQVFIGSDSGIYKGGRANHPRAYGNYPRFLGRFVREKKLLPLEKAIVKCTSQPAGRLGLKDRGLIKEGCQADLVLFDPEKIRDMSSETKPAILSEGIRQVWVNGTTAWIDGQETGARKGHHIMGT